MHSFCTIWPKSVKNIEKNQAIVLSPEIVSIEWIITKLDNDIMNN